MIAIADHKGQIMTATRNAAELTAEGTTPPNVIADSDCSRSAGESPPIYTPLGLLRLASDTVRRCTQIAGQMSESVHEVVHGNYNEKFRREHRTRYTFESTDGVKLTARILNPEFLRNNQHAIVYSYSLAVPGNHGVELPTLADIAEHGERTGRAVIAITTDGLAGPTNPLKITNFWQMVHRRFEFLRYLLPDEKRLIVTGASLGGMMSHALAASWEEEAEQSGHLLEVTHDLAVASAGHHKYTLRELPGIGVQFVWHESRAVGRYVAAGNDTKLKIQRGFELIGTIPRHPGQCLAIGCVAVSILCAPLEGKEHQIPHETDIVDLVFDDDGVTHPNRRAELWQNCDHPNVTHASHPANHVDGLLTIGREETLHYLSLIPTVEPT